ncbi:SET and MYND domain-containing protein 3 [Mortierella alpina]|nr:SET and MYND domain-containing protein 3 [Mortierella alpina]
MDTSNVAEGQSPPSPSSAAAPSLRPSTNRAKRHYRTKPRGEDSDDANEQVRVPAQDGTLSSDSTASSTTKATAAESNLPYVQSQNAQNIAEVYPGLARLSFLDQEQATHEQDVDSGAFLLGAKTRRPLQQKSESVTVTQVGSASTQPDGSMANVRTAERSKPSIPPVSSPSALSAGTKTGTSLVEIKETGSVGKGRGVFSSAAHVLTPGTLVFKELGYCQVVNDASLSQVCSACFKNTREEQGEDEKAASSGGISASGQRKLVRCAGCKVVWYCNKACQIKDWKLHHQMECQGIQKSMTDPVMKDVWTKRAMDTTAVRALCRLVRRRERVRKSMAYRTEHGKIDAAQKQANEVYFSGLDQREEEWLDEHGSTWIEQYLNVEESERPSRSLDGSPNSSMQHSSQLAKIMAIVTSCVVTPMEDRRTFLKGGDSGSEGAEVGGFSLLRTLMSYGFSITNLETTSEIGLSLYVQCMPFMNHSCVPNCVYTFRGSRVECRVIRDVQPGEELTISYIDQIGTTRERQRQLQDQYHFTCDCPFCKFYPANPMIQPDEAPLRAIAPDLPFSSVLDAKQGFVCRNAACTGVLATKPILAIESQLAIYNKVELKCQQCGNNAELTLELVEENQEDAKRLMTAFVREMNAGTTPRTGSRNFELAKAVVPASANAKVGDAADTPVALGGLTTVEEPSASALQYFDTAYKKLTAALPPQSRGRTPANTAIAIEDEDLIPRSDLHQLTRQLVQTAFDEAVSHKNWNFALSQSIQLEYILKNTYVGHHPLKAIQGYYTCKIANLLANLLLEESTVEIDEGEQGVKDENDDMAGDTDDENDLKALRDAMTAGGRAPAASSVGTGSLQEQLLRGKRKENENEELTRDSDSKQRKKKAHESIGSKRSQAQSSQEMMQRLKSLIPKLEDPSILQQFRVCWGKDGKLASRYRYQIDSLKQALHYAQLPFSEKPE